MKLDFGIKRLKNSESLQYLKFISILVNNLENVGINILLDIQVLYFIFIMFSVLHMAVFQIHGV